MKRVEPGTNGNHWLEQKQRPSVSIVQPFVCCLAPSFNSLDRAISPLKTEELFSLAHCTCSIIYMYGVVSYMVIA